MFENLAETAARDAEKYYGKYPGLVLDNAPPEDAAHRGELRVQVPGVLEETPGGAGQQPIEVVARPCFVPGFFFLPEAGAQVWVEFVAGDVNSPLWTGVWYPTDMTPLTVEGEEGPTEFQKVIRTASGHLIQLDDTEGEEKVVVQHALGTSVTIDKEGHVVLEHKDGMTIEVTADKAIAVTSDTVTLTADVTVDGTLSVTGDATIEGAASVTGDTTVEGDLTVGKGPTTTISGNEITGG